MRDENMEWELEAPYLASLPRTTPFSVPDDYFKHFPSQVESVIFLNVLENAVKYGSNTITIKTILNKNEFGLSIQDNGIGISKNKHLLLFDKFYRVEQGNLHNSKGLGLGLYYVNQIIKAHQGTIAVISDLGKGAKFYISIPLN